MTKKYSNLFLFLCIFLLSAVMVVGSDWTSFQRGSNLNAVQGSSTGIQLANSSTAVIADASVVQPLIIDMDNDGENELVYQNSGTINIYKFNNGAFSSQGSVSTFGASSSYPISSTDDVNSDGYPEVVVVQNDTVNVIHYNASTASYQVWKSQATVSTQVQGVNCITSTTLQQCYWLSSTTVIRYYPHNNTYFTYPVTGSGIPSTQRDQNVFSPLPIENLYGDGKLMLWYMSDNRSYMLDVDTATPETRYSSNGILEDSMPSLESLDRGGVTSLLFSTVESKFYLYYNTGGVFDAPTIAQITKSGIVTEKQLTTGTDSPKGNILVQDFMGSSAFEFCGIETTSGSARRTLKCWDVTSGAVVFSANPTGLDYGFSTASNELSTTGLMQAVKLNGDTKYSIVTPRNILKLSGNDTVTSYNISLDHQFSSEHLNAVGILGTGNNINICGANSTYLTCAYSGYVNQNPELHTNRSLGKNYLSPVCLGTAVTFTAKECPQSNCHYTNDLSSDRERLVSDCGFNATLQNGSYSLANPTFSCVFNNEGNFNVVLYLQDEANPTNLTQFQSFTYFITNASSGQTCNLPVGSSVLQGETIVSADTDDFTSKEEVQNTVDILTQQSTFIKTIVVVMLALAVIISAGHAGITSPFIHASLLTLVMLVCSIIGLISFIFFLMFSLTLIILGIGMMFAGRGNAE